MLAFGRTLIYVVEIEIEIPRCKNTVLHPYAEWHLNQSRHWPHGPKLGYAPLWV